MTQHTPLEQRAEAWFAHLAGVLEVLPLADLDDTALRVSFETVPGQYYLLNWHGPLQQIWLVSPVSGPSHYAFDTPSQAWRCTRTAQSLEDLLMAEVSQALNAKIIL